MTILNEIRPEFRELVSLCPCEGVINGAQCMALGTHVAHTSYRAFVLCHDCVTFHLYSDRMRLVCLLRHDA